MNEISPIASIGAQSASNVHSTPITSPAETGLAHFADMIAHGLEQMEAKVDRANELVRAFALDDSIPVHEVTIALEDARIAVELAMQVRSRMVEAYREVMNMQL